MEFVDKNELSENELTKKKFHLVKLINDNITTKARLDKGIYDCNVADVYETDEIIHSEIQCSSDLKEVSIDIKTGDYMCTCGDYSIRRNLCKHIIATLLTLPQDIIKKIIRRIRLNNNMGD